jgi:hypothetical protein
MAEITTVLDQIVTQSLVFANPLVVRFDRPYTYCPPRVISGPLTFSANTTGAIPGARFVIELTADGVNANVPVFPDNLFTRLNSSGSWVNTAGTVNIVEIQRLSNVNYFTITQTVPAAATPVVIDPAVETFISMPRRTADISLVGSTYTGTATSSIFSSLGQSDIKMVGDGYVRVEAGTVNSGRPIWGLSSSASTLNAYTGWLFTVARNIERNYCDFFASGGAYQNSAFVPVTADLRLIRTGTQVKVQQKIPAASTWTDVFTFTQTFSGNLWFNMSLNDAQNSMNATLVNPRMFGAS